METVFEAENNIEAHMIVHLLDRSGIKAEIVGEHLQGGVGELAAYGNVRVVVEPEDAPRARQIIADWDSEVTAGTAAEAPATKRRGGTYSGLVGFVAGAGLASIFLLWAYNTPVGSRTSDYNRDGRADEWVYWRGDNISRVELDRDFDGQVDERYRYTPRKGPTGAEYDNDFNGRLGSS